MLAAEKNILRTKEIYRGKTEKYLISINVTATHIIRRTIIPILTTIARFCLPAFFKIALTTRKTANVGTENGKAHIKTEKNARTDKSSDETQSSQTPKRIIKSAIQKRTVAFIFSSLDSSILKTKCYPRMPKEVRPLCLRKQINIFLGSLNKRAKCNSRQHPPLRPLPPKSL